MAPAPCLHNPADGFTPASAAPTLPGQQRVPPRGSHRATSGPALALALALALSRR